MTQFTADKTAYLRSHTWLAAFGMAACLWIAVEQAALGDQYGFLEGGFQIAVAVLLLLVVLEAARRAIGWPLPSVAVAALASGGLVIWRVRRVRRLLAEHEGQS